MKLVHWLAGSFLILVLSFFSAPAADDYKPGPDSEAQPDAPKGKVEKFTFAGSKVFPGTTRNYWVYTPAQYEAAKPACLMVFQDGLLWNAPVVFDNLIHKKEIPVLIGVFVQPGVVPALSSNALPRYNRSFEYDSLGDRYARFLLDELLPEVRRRWNFSSNANDCAIAGASSGGICAFTAAWERPESFRRVFSSIGSFTDLRGGNVYPALIRKTEPKPLRVFLQDGSNDLNIYAGSWWIANQDVFAALQFAGCDVTNTWGEGGHNGKHATAVFPEAVRWLWRDWPAPVKANADAKSKAPLLDILLPGEDWQLVSEGHKFTEGPAANAQGEVFFTDIPNSRIHKIGLDGKASVFAENTGSANGLMFGPDGKLHACAKRQLVAYAPDGRMETLVADVDTPNDLCITAKGEIYFTVPSLKQVRFVDAKRETRVVDTGIAFPNGLRLTPDQSLLLVADTRGQFVYSFQVQPDGSLAHKQIFTHLELVDGSTQSGADGMTFDTQGRLYVTTEMGLQVCDPPGRVNGIILKPQRAWLSNVVFGGAHLDELYVTCGDKVFKRKTKARGVLSFQPPIKPPPPKL